MLSTPEAISLTSAGAVAIALFQLTLKGISRLRLLQDGKGVKDFFSKEDFAFWHEWIVTALVTMTLFMVKNWTGEQRPSLTMFLGYLAMLVAGLLVMPFSVAFILCGKDGKPRNILSLAVADFIGLIFLIAVVAMGVKVYA